MPDDKMVRFAATGIVTHRSCAQFTADVLGGDASLRARAEFLSRSQSDVAELNRPGVFHVRVQRAMDLPASQAPYARLALLPWKDHVQTKAVEDGGRAPVWTPDLHDSAFQLAHMYNSAITPFPLLEVEVWNSNYLADDLIGDVPNPTVGWRDST